MTNFTNITKYLCTIETKNYPVTTIIPNIQRYSSIKKRLNASEIASCLAACAIVTLHKNNGANVRLNKDSFRQVLLKYKDEILVQESKKVSNEESKKNMKYIEEIKNEELKVIESETAVKRDVIIPAETESLEEMQSDPEDPDTLDLSDIYYNTCEKE